MAVDIPKLMPHAVNLDVRREPELDFRYRLIGTYVAEHLFKDHTGSWFSEIEYQRAPSTIWQNCARVIETGKPLLPETPYVGPNQGFKGVEDVILPSLMTAKLSIACWCLSTTCAARKSHPRSIPHTANYCFAA